jgi:hypothetical protein
MGRFIDKLIEYRGSKKEDGCDGSNTKYINGVERVMINYCHQMVIM